MSWYSFQLLFEGTVYQFFFLNWNWSFILYKGCAEANQQIQKDLQKLAHSLYILQLLSYWKLHISSYDTSMQPDCKCLLHTDPTKIQLCKTLMMSRLIIWNLMRSPMRWGIFFDIHWNYITTSLFFFWNSEVGNCRSLVDWGWLGMLRQNQIS